MSIVWGPHRPTGLRLYEATTRNSPPTDQSVDYSCCRLCKRQCLAFVACLCFFFVRPHHRVCRTHKQIPKVSSTNPHLSDSDRRRWYLTPLVFLAAQQAWTRISVRRQEPRPPLKHYHFHRMPRKRSSSSDKSLSYS